LTSRWRSKSGARGTKVWSSSILSTGIGGLMLEGGLEAFSVNRRNSPGSESDLPSESQEFMLDARTLQ
jgi:hypothetical protein